jgi:hypothetical protein
VRDWSSGRESNAWQGTASTDCQPLSTADARLPGGHPVLGLELPLRGVGHSTPRPARLGPIMRAPELSIGVASHVSNTFWRLIVDSQRRISQEASSVEKSAYKELMSVIKNTKLGAFQHDAGRSCAATKFSAFSGGIVICGMGLTIAARPNLPPGLG